MLKKVTALCLTAWLVLSGAVPVLAGEDHAHHHPVVSGYTRSLQSYREPDVRLQREDGTRLSTAELFRTDKTVIVSFIFTSCSAICPILTATLVQANKLLGPEAEAVQIVSVSIDPEYDTPKRLQEYARQFQVSGDWHFYTGEPAAIVSLQNAFQAYRGDKNNHAALVLLRPQGQKQWVRLDGFTSAEELVSEIRRAPTS